MTVLTLTAVDFKDKSQITKEVRVIFGPGVSYHSNEILGATVITIIGGTIGVVESPNQIDKMLGMTPAKPTKQRS